VLATRDTDRAAVLSAGDIATISDTALAIAHHANVGRLTAWLQGGLAFDAIPLSEVVRDLERTFNVDVTIADSTLESRRITATIGREESFDAVLSAMTVPIGAQYQRFGRRIVIRSQITGVQ
jgi:ferric-dicitrate binding protein FerR (iron transport regulator)